MGEVERVDEDAVGEVDEEVGRDRLVIEYEDDPIENYDTRLLIIGISLSFLFGVAVAGYVFFFVMEGL